MPVLYLETVSSRNVGLRNEKLISMRRKCGDKKLSLQVVNS